MKGSNMKKLILYVTVILLISTTENVFALELAEWQYRCRINLSGDNAEKYTKVDITPEIYDIAKLGLLDIRIIDSSQQQIPYLLTRPKDIDKKHKYAPRVINRSTDDKSGSLATLDFGKQTIKNCIEVETGGNNFRRAVKVEGSNDNVTFFTLVEQGFIFAVDNKKSSRFSNIDLPVNDYRYLRIAVEPMGTEKKRPVINEIRAFKREKKPAAKTTAEMVRVNHTEDEKKKLSIYEYDLRFRNLPVSEIQLDIADESFYRHITVEGRNAATRKVKLDSEDNRERYREVEEYWKNLICNTIYRYISSDGKKHEKTSLPIPSGRQAYRYLKITVRNYDDRPLKLETASAKMIPHQIMFDADSSFNGWLYVGCKSAASPRYDITYKMTKPSEIDAASAKLSPIADNPLFGKFEQKLQPWTERHKVLLLTIMAAVALVLGGFILKSFKSIQTPSES
jgi:hypothetical protein